MKYGSLIIEKKEYVLLKRILNISSYAKDFDTQRAIKCLNDNLKNAQILDEEDVPKDVIRFNSNILVEFNENLTPLTALYSMPTMLKFPSFS